MALRYDTKPKVFFWNEESDGWVSAHVGPKLGVSVFAARTRATGDRDSDFNEARLELASFLAQVAEAARSRAQYH